MEIGNKILELRKKNNLSQEQLAEKMKVARQTISKWELGETSPDIKQAKELSKIFNVSLDELVDNDIKDLVIEKVSNTEKLAGMILKIIKIFLIIIPIGIVLIFLLAFLFRFAVNSEDTGREIEENIYCKLYGEEHGYSITYQELTGRPIAQGGDSYFYDILDLGKYDDAHQIFNVINDYVKKNGGTCEMIKEKDLSNSVDIEIKNLTSTSMKIVIHDNNSNRLVYGEDFYIEKYVKGSWKEIETTGENYGFNAIAYYVDKDGLLEMNQNWEHIYGKLPKGLYRIVKNVFFESDIPVNEENQFYIWQEFEIEN